MLVQLKQVWSSSGHTHDTKMIWAACTIFLFAFLRAGEMTVPNDQAFDESLHLSVNDRAVDDPIKPSIVQIKIKQSKTDPFQRGVILFVGKTGMALCPVSAILDYLSARGMSAGPLFQYKDGHPLTRQKFVDAVRKGLQQAEV